MELIEIFAMLGFPVRLVGRIPVFARYAFGPPSEFLKTSEYAMQRYGKSYRFRVWLRFDIVELEKIEHMINYGDDEEVLHFRQTQLASGATTTVVVGGILRPSREQTDGPQGSLLAATCATMLTLESISDVELYVRALFTISLIVSLLSVYFTLVQQRELGLPTSAATLRRWLCNGNDARASPGQLDHEGPAMIPVPNKQSSLAANILLQLPFELLSIAISLFLAALATYIGLAVAQRVQLGTGAGLNNTGYLVALLVITAFTLIVFGQALGAKDREALRCADIILPHPPDKRRPRHAKEVSS